MLLRKSGKYSGRFENTCNGTLCTHRGGYLLDKSIHKVKLENVCCGANQIVVGCGYTHDMELEDVYLCGFLFANVLCCFESILHNFVNFIF